MGTEESWKEDRERALPGGLETMAICGCIPSGQSVRVFKFYVLVSMKILVYINISMTWMVWISSYNLMWT